MQFRVEKSKLTATDITGIVGKTIKYLTASFTFDETWDGWTKTAWFEQNGIAKSYLLVDDEVPALSNLNLDNGICNVYVSATMGDARRTTSIVTFSVIHTGSLVGTVPNDTPLTVIEQMTSWLTALDNTGDGTKYLADDGTYKEVSGGSETSTLAWYPSVDSDGNLTWEQSESAEAPESVNIKGADGQDGAAGQDGESGIPDEVTVTDTGGTGIMEYTIQPNTLYQFPSLIELDLTLASGTAGQVNEYMFTVTADSTDGLTLILPQNVTMSAEVAGTAGKYYEVSILNNKGLSVEW